MSEFDEMEEQDYSLYCDNCGSCGEDLCCKQSCEECGVYTDDEFGKVFKTSSVGDMGLHIYIKRENTCT